MKLANADAMNLVYIQGKSKPNRRKATPPIKAAKHNPIHPAHTHHGLCTGSDPCISTGALGIDGSS